MTRVKEPSYELHRAVEIKVRNRCPDADELLEMIGVTVDGVLQPDDDRDYGDVDTAQLGSRAKADKVVSIYDDLHVRPKVSSAPDALRNLPPVVVAPAPKPKVKRKSSGPRRPPASPEAPCGTYSAVRRHRRRGEPICDLCAVAPAVHPGAAEKKAAKRRAAGIPERTVNCGTRAGYQRHRRDDEPACRPCQDAESAYTRARYAKKLNRPVQHRGAPQCGTISGAKTHRVSGDPICKPCLEAERTYTRERRARKKAAA